MKKSKIVLIFFVILLSTVFFWATTNRFLYPSRANSVQVGVTFEQAVKTAQQVPGQQQIVPINILFTTRPENHISGATVVVRYDPMDLEYIDEPENTVDPTCQTIGFKFPHRVRMENDPTSGVLIVSRVGEIATAQDQLPSGRFCWGTVSFRLKNTRDTKVSLESTDTSAWEIVGPEGVFSPRFDEPRIMTITPNTTIENHEGVQGIFDIRL